MAKVAKVRFLWVKSPSTVTKAVIDIVNDGVATHTELDPSVQEYAVEMSPLKSCSISIYVVDADGLQSPTATYTATMGTLELPMPVTGLTHVVDNVHELSIEPLHKKK